MLTSFPLLVLPFFLLSSGYIPDFLLRPIIRTLCRERLGRITAGDLAEKHERKMNYIESLKARDVIADSTAEANEQHYEVRLAEGSRA